MGQKGGRIIIMIIAMHMRARVATHRLRPKISYAYACPYAHGIVLQLWFPAAGRAISNHPFAFLGAPHDDPVRFSGSSLFWVKPTRKGSRPSWAAGCYMGAMRRDPTSVVSKTCESKLACTSSDRIPVCSGSSHRLLNSQGSVCRSYNSPSW